MFMFIKLRNKLDGNVDRIGFNVIYMTSYKKKLKFLN